MDSMIGYFSYRTHKNWVCQSECSLPIESLSPIHSAPYSNHMSGNITSPNSTRIELHLSPGQEDEVVKIVYSLFLLYIGASNSEEWPGSLSVYHGLSSSVLRQLLGTTLTVFLKNQSILTLGCCGWLSVEPTVLRKLSGSLWMFYWIKMNDLA